MNSSAHEQAVDSLHRLISGSLGGELIADFPCNKCPMVHPVDLAHGVTMVELGARSEESPGDLLLYDQDSNCVTSISVLLGGEPGGSGGTPKSELRVVEFHLIAKRRGRGNRRRRPSLDSGLAVTTRLAELSSGQLYVDRHNLECPRPVCVGCRQTLPLRTISIREVSCWECGRATKVALGIIDTKILYPDDFTHEEREFAVERGGATLCIQSSSAFGDSYLANVCVGCASVQGDWTLDVDVHERTLRSEADRRVAFGPCGWCADISPSPQPSPPGEGALDSPSVTACRK